MVYFSKQSDKEGGSHLLSAFLYTSMAHRLLVDKLCNASARGDLPEVTLLLQNGVHVNGINTYNRTALQVGIHLSK